jgi:hypothetical protein
MAAYPINVRFTPKSGQSGIAANMGLSDHLFSTLAIERRARVRTP